jgi:glutamate carboxypeptidase
MNPTALADFCRQQLPETLNILRQMVAINSFTENAAGVNRLGQLTARVFAPLGFLPAFFQASLQCYGNHLVLKRPRRDGMPTVALISHLDTVFPEEEERRNAFAWRPEGTRIYGPGTNDIKGGTALIHLTLSALRHADPATFENTNWVILLNASEETLSGHFGDLCRAQLPPETLACLLFEADGSNEDESFALVAARKGRATFRVEVEGRGAHAGSTHHRGANAVVQLAHTLTRLAALTDYAVGLTVNIGSAQGGTVANRVPHAATAELEMRAFSPEVYQQAKTAILAHAGDGEIRSGDGHPCRITITVDHETAPWPVNPATEHLLTHWQQIGRELGWKVERQERGGLSDGNVLWNDFPTLDGLGPRGDQSHCSEHSPDGSKIQEWVDATSFVPKAVLNAMALSRILAL